MHNIISYDFFKKIQSLDCVEKIILFGSRARQQNKERADIDLAIVCPTADEILWFDILEIIEDADTLLKIDCVRFDTLPLDSELRANILKEGIELYVKNHLRTKQASFIKDEKN